MISNNNDPYLGQGVIHITPGQLNPFVDAHNGMLYAQQAELEYKVRMKRLENVREEVKKLSNRELLEAIYVKLYS